MGNEVGGLEGAFVGLLEGCAVGNGEGAIEGLAVGIPGVTVGTIVGF